MVTRKRIVLLAAFALITGLALAVHDLVADLPDPRTLLLRAPSGTTKLLDRQGRLLYEFLDPRAGSRTRVDLAQIPLACRQATVATEDADYYVNAGVDLRGILRAAWLNVTNREIVSGGSTLTQQLARIAFLSESERAQRSLRRKLREAILAFRMAQTWSKDTILEVYLNEVYYGELAYGIEAAAQTYFDVSAAQLDLAQCALLVGLPQRPAQYNPLVALDAAKARQRTVLDLMVRQGYITREQADLAHAEPLKLVGHRGLVAPHFVVYVRNQLEDQLGAETLLRDGWVITTTLDLDLQRTAEEIVQRRLRDLHENDAHDAAVVVMDVRTGDVLAMVGSADYADATIDGAVNMVTALRQPGSAMKPILYAAAFMQGWSPSDVVYDVRTAFVADESASSGGSQTYVPANYDNQFHGPVSLRDALANSYNLPAVILQKRVGTENFMRLARAMGLTTLTDPRRYGLTLTLGGGEVRLLDLTAAYAVLAKGGRRVEPRVVLTFTPGLSPHQTEGSVSPDPTGMRVEGNQVLDPRVAYLATDILSDNRARMPSFGEFSPLRLSRPAAAKTGTTSNWRDNWTVGYTPELVTGVWVGNADNHAMHNISGIAGAGPIWHDVMEAAHRQRPVTTFAQPAGIEEREVCVINGLTPGPHCPYRRTDLFLAETSRRPVEHEYVRIKTNGVEHVVWIPPIELQDWAAERALPSPVKDGGRVGDGGLLGITLTAPDPNTIIVLDPHLPRDAQRIEVAAQVRVDAAHVEFMADGRMWTSVSTVPYHTWWAIQPGTHRISAVAVLSDGSRIASQPVVITVIDDEGRTTNGQAPNG